MEIMYLAKAHPSLTLKLAGKRWQAVNGVFKLTPEAAAELESLMKTRADIRSLVSKIDLEQAAQVAKDFIANHQPQAVKGPFTTSNAAQQVLRNAIASQKPENLTGSMAPVNLSTLTKSNKPLDVEQMVVTPPKTSLLNRVGKS